MSENRKHRWHDGQHSSLQAVSPWKVIIYITHISISSQTNSFVFQIPKCDIISFIDWRIEFESFKIKVWEFSELRSSINWSVTLNGDSVWLTFRALEACRTSWTTSSLTLRTECAKAWLSAATAIQARRLSITYCATRTILKWRCSSSSAKSEVKLSLISLSNSAAYCYSNRQKESSIIH